MAQGEQALVADSLESDLGFGGFRWTAKRQAEGTVDLVCRLCAGILFQARSEITDLLEHERIVAERERLQRRGGGEPLGCKVGGIRAIQRGEKLVRCGADDEAINAASPEIGSVRRDITVNGCVGLGVFKVAITRTAGLEVELAAGRQHGIAHLLSLQSAGGLPPKETVVGIGRHAVGGVGHLTVGDAGDDETGDGLDRAIAGAEFLGKPIEQLRVRGLLSATAEVAGGFDDPVSKSPLPKAIGHHAVDEGVVLVGDPVSEGESTFGFGRRHAAEVGVEHLQGG